MDSYYDEKQQRRRRELNSRRDSSQNDDRKQRKNRGKKQFELVRENMDDFHPDHTQGSIQCTECPSSPISDDEVVEFRAMTTQAEGVAADFTFSAVTEQMPGMVDLAGWITTGRELVITPVEQRYAAPYPMKNKCRRARPIVDNTILRDLQRAFNNPPTVQLSEMIRCCQTLPYWIHTSDGELEEKAKKFMSDFGLTDEQLLYIHNINQKVTLRSSYGILFLQGNKFFAKTTLHRGSRRSAIKGYPILKSTGEWEHPWETAVRITTQDVQFWNSETEEWQWLNLDEHAKENERQKYLECLLTGVQHTEHLRYIGLFVIRLESDVQIRVNGDDQVEEEDNWYSIGEKVNSSTFYTIRPFLKYLQEHPDFA